MDSQRLQEQNSGLFRNQATPYVITIVHWNKLNKIFHDTCIWEKKKQSCSHWFHWTAKIKQSNKTKLSLIVHLETWKTSHFQHYGTARFLSASERICANAFTRSNTNTRVTHRLIIFFCVFLLFFLFFHHFILCLHFYSCSPRCSIT